MVDDTDWERFLAKWLPDHFIALYTPSIGTGLAVNIAGNLGDAMLKGHEVQEGAASTAVTVPASVTQSIWLALTRDGNGKVNGAQYTVAVAQPADSMKICDFTSGVSTVTSVTDQRGPLTIKFIKQVQTAGATTLTVTSTGGTWIYLGFVSVEYASSGAGTLITVTVNLRRAAVNKDTRTTKHTTETAAGGTFRFDFALGFTEVIPAGSATIDMTTSTGSMFEGRIVAVELAP